MSKSRAEVNSYYHGPVDIGTGNSADYVVAHAKRQAQRGRNPSVPYKGIGNSRVAHQTAEADIKARATDPKSLIDYTAPNAGRVAIMYLSNKYQEDSATAYAKARMEDNLSVGAVLHVLQEDETPPQYHATDHGTVELTYRHPDQLPFFP